MTAPNIIAPSHPPQHTGTLTSFNFRDMNCPDCRIGCISHLHGDHFVYLTSSSHARRGEIWFHRFDLHTNECSCEYGQAHPHRERIHTARAALVAAQENACHEVRVVDSIGPELFAADAPKVQPAEKALRLEDIYEAA